MIIWTIAFLDLHQNEHFFVRFLIENQIRNRTPGAFISINRIYSLLIASNRNYSYQPARKPSRKTDTNRNNSNSAQTIRTSAHKTQFGRPSGSSKMHSEFDLDVRLRRYGHLKVWLKFVQKFDILAPKS